VVDVNIGGACNIYVGFLRSSNVVRGMHGNCSYG